MRQGTPVSRRLEWHGMVPSMRQVIAVSVLAISAALAIAGCDSAWFHEPRPPSLTVENRTAKDIRLYYVRGQTEFPDIYVAPGTSTSFTLAFGMETSECASGSLLAKDGPSLIAKIDHPCAGTTWTIDPSSAPS